METCKNFPYTKVKIEDDVDCVIDLEAEPTFTDSIERWCNDMTQTINKTIQLDSLYEKFVDDLMATYYTSLNHKLISSREKFILRDKVLSHIKCFYLYYKEIVHNLANTNYFIRMEDILTYYCNLELELIYRLSKQKECKRHSLLVLKRLSKVLGIFLHYKLKHIMHVLLRITFNIRNETCQILMRKLYIHFLMSMPTEPFSDEAFCRYYLLFERCKDVTQPEEKEKLDKFVYVKFDKTKDYLSTNSLMKSVLTPPITITNIVDQMLNFRNAQIAAYFEYLKNSQVEEMSKLSTNIDAHCGSDDFSKTYNDLLSTFSETSINIVNADPFCVDSDSDVIAVDEEGTVVLSDDDDIAEIIYKQKYIKSKHKTKRKPKLPISDNGVINLDSDDESSVDKTLTLSNSVEKIPSDSLDVTFPASPAVIPTLVTTLASSVSAASISTVTNVVSTPSSPVPELLTIPEETETIISNTTVSSVNTTLSAPTVQQSNLFQTSPSSVSSSLSQSIPSTSTEAIQVGESSETSNLFSQSILKLLGDETEKGRKETVIERKINGFSERKEKECEGIGITSSMSFLSRQFSPIRTPSLFSSPIQTPSLFDTMSSSHSSSPNLDLFHQTSETKQSSAETTSLVQGTLLLISKLKINEEAKSPTLQTPSTETGTNVFFSKQFEDDKQSDAPQIPTSFPVEVQTTNELSSKVHTLPSVFTLETNQSKCSSYSSPITSTATTQSLSPKISTVSQDLPEDTTEQAMISSYNQSEIVLPPSTDSSTVSVSTEIIQTVSSLQQTSDQNISPPIQDDISLVEKQTDVSIQLEMSKISHEDSNEKSMLSFPMDKSSNSPTTSLSQQICQSALPSQQLSLEKISEFVQDSKSAIDKLALIQHSEKTSIQPLLHSPEDTRFEQRNSPNLNLNVQLSVEPFLPPTCTVPIVSSIETLTSTEMESLPLESESQASLSPTALSTSSIHLTTETSPIISKQIQHNISSDNNTLEPIFIPKIQLEIPTLTIYRDEDASPSETPSSKPIIFEKSCAQIDCDLCLYKRSKKCKATKKSRKASKVVSQNFGVITPPSDENLPDEPFEDIYNSHSEFLKKHLSTDTTCLKNIVIQKVETVSNKDISISYNQNEVNNTMKYSGPEQDGYCDTGQFFLKNFNTDQNLEIEETVVQAIPPTTLPSIYNCEPVNNNVQKTTSILKTPSKKRSSRSKELNEFRNDKSTKEYSHNDEHNKAQKILYTSEVINPKVDDFSNLKNIYSNLVGTNDNNELDRILSGPIGSMNGFNTNNSQYYENSDSNFNLFGYANSVPPLFGDVSKNLIAKEIDSPAYNEMDSDDFRDYIENEFRYKNVLAPAEPSKSTNSDGGHASGKCGVVFNDVVDTRFIEPTYIKQKKNHSCDYKKLRMVIRNRIKCFIDPYDEKLNMTTKVVLNKISDNDLLNKYKVINHNTLRSCIRKKIDCNPATKYVPTTKSDFLSKETVAGIDLDEPPKQLEYEVQINSNCVEDTNIMFDGDQGYFITSSDLPDEKAEVDVVGIAEDELDELKVHSANPDLIATIENFNPEDSIEREEYPQNTLTNLETIDKEPNSTACNYVMENDYLNQNFLNGVYHKENLQNEYMSSANETNTFNYLPDDLCAYFLAEKGFNKGDLLIQDQPVYFNGDGYIYNASTEVPIEEKKVNIDGIMKNEHIEEDFTELNHLNKNNQENVGVTTFNANSSDPPANINYFEKDIPKSTSDSSEKDKEVINLTKSSMISETSLNCTLHEKPRINSLSADPSQVPSSTERKTRQLPIIKISRSLYDKHAHESGKQKSSKKSKHKRREYRVQLKEFGKITISTFQAQLNKKLAENQLAINNANTNQCGAQQPKVDETTASSESTERTVENFNTHSNVKFLNDCSKLHERKANEGVTVQKSSHKRKNDCLYNVKTPDAIKPDNKVSSDCSDQLNVKDTANQNFSGTGNSVDENEPDVNTFYGELSDAELTNLIESLSSGSETRLPFKKRRVSVNVKQEVKYDPKKEEISYPATPMISIAEIEALQNKATNIRSFKTPAERKEMPPLPVYYNVNSEPSPIITDQFNINNHTYNNPTINYHMSNMPMPFIPCASYFPISPIILPFNNLPSFEQTNAANVSCNKATGLPQPFKPVKKEKKSKDNTSYSASCCYN